MEIDYMRKAGTNNILRIDNRDYKTNDGENFYVHNFSEGWIKIEDKIFINELKQALRSFCDWDAVLQEDSTCKCKTPAQTIREEVEKFQNIIKLQTEDTVVSCVNSLVEKTGVKITTVIFRLDQLREIGRENSVHVLVDLDVETNDG